MSENESRFNSLLAKPTALTDEEIQEMRRFMAHPTSSMVRPHILGMAQLRVHLELVESIRSFDKASGRLVETTNKLTKWILRLTVLATLLGAASVVASGWPYLTWWIKNGFRFH